MSINFYEFVLKMIEELGWQVKEYEKELIKDYLKNSKFKYWS